MHLLFFCFHLKNESPNLPTNGPRYLAYTFRLMAVCACFHRDRKLAYKKIHYEVLKWASPHMMGECRNTSKYQQYFMFYY